MIRRVIGIAILVTAIFYWPEIRGILPAIRPALSPSPLSTTSPQGTSLTPGNTTGYPLTIPEGTMLETFARDVAGARVMVFDTLGNLWVSQTSEGTISLVEIKNGQVMRQSIVFKNLRKPHGLAFDPDDPFVLYIAEEHRISQVRVYSEGQLEKIVDLPSGAGHFTRTIAFGPSATGQPERLYVSIGSSCNVCNETDNRRAKIFTMKKDGSDFKEYARGLRNSVFFTWHPATAELWATDNGRDNLGDNLPPDEINIIKQGKNYGWPICYGDNVHDTQFDKNTYIRNPCEEPTEIPAYINIPAHSAALGLAFVPSQGGWPSDWQNDLLVAYHGSWNRSVPTGYKIARFDLNRTGSVVLSSQDFISGWLAKSGGRVYGRPVGITPGPDGALYISDDKAGLVYRLRYVGP